jgi:hypothetical protein
MRSRFPVWLMALLLPALLGQAPLPRAQTAAPNATPAASPERPSPSPAPSPAAADIRRLILKDGSYQVVAKFEVQGGRVRYLSAERNEWEEVPYSLVDWAATAQYAREKYQPAVSPEVLNLEAETETERRQEDARSPLVAPGLRLPETGGVFLLDVYKQEAQLNELAQAGGEVKRNLGGNILRATVNPLAGQREPIELPGVHARIQAHVANPFFYIKVEPPQDAKGHPIPHVDAKGWFRIIRLEPVPKKGVRAAGDVKIPIYGKVSQQEKFVPSKCEFLPGQTGPDAWLKLTAAEPLETGEYAVVEMLEDNQMNLYVWDFGVNRDAPPNAGAWFSGKP